MRRFFSPVKFVVPNEVLIAPAVYEMHYAKLGYSMLEENLFLTSWLILVGAGLIALIAEVVTVVRPPKQTSTDIMARITQPMLVVLAVTVLFW